jgi:hypothetical protein
VVLAPQEELTLTIEETATHTSLRRSAAQIKALLGEEWLVGSGEGVLRAPARAALAAFVHRDERSALLAKVYLTLSYRVRISARVRVGCIAPRP